MSATRLAANLNPVHSERMIVVHLYRFRIQRVEKARPTRSRVELRLGSEKLRAAASALLHSGFMAIPVLTREGGLRAFLS